MRVLACIQCRKQKVACDHSEPACKRCLVSGNECGYPTRRGKKVLQRSRAREFETRLVQLESQFLQKDHISNIGNGQEEADKEDNAMEKEEIAEWKDLSFPWFLRPERFPRFPTAESNIYHVQEALPDIRLQQELYHIYFQQIHPSAPMIHKSRFSRALTGDPSCAPPLALKYAMWAVAASKAIRHQHIAENFYILGRKHAEDLEMKDTLFSPSSAQCWYLLATYEASRAYLKRAWMSVGRCVRLVQMMAMHRLDSPHDEEYILPQASCWTEMEEWRRTFWASYFADRWASTISGYPLSIEDEHVCTNLPSSEDAFEYEIEEVGVSLGQAGGAGTMAYLSPFAGSIFTTAILGRCLRQIQSQEDLFAADIDSDYWDNHRQVDYCVSQTFMNLPHHLRTSPVAEDVNVVFLHLNLHTTVILLHQTAVKKLAKHKLDPATRENSLQRCLVSSVEIKNIIQSIKDLRNFPVHMWIGFCVYVAAGVFIDDVRTTRHSSNSSVDLGLLLVALKILGSGHAILKVFAQKLESDISRTGVGSSIPVDLRKIAGISVANSIVSSDGSSIDAQFCIADEAS